MSEGEATEVTGIFIGNAITSFAEFWMTYMTAIMVLGMTLRLYFMLDVRRRARLDAEE